MNEQSVDQIGEYTLLERIGRGGMCTVYHAHSASGEDVALKVLKFDPYQEESEIFLVRFEREARIIADLQHPNILPMLDYGSDGDYIYLTMRLMSGGTLSNVIKQGTIAPQQATKWLNQIGGALEHAHKLQVIHRDLKPSNVLLDESGNAYLTDFGIARFANSVSDLTETGSVLGTPAYMAPEQWRDEPLDERTDVYGLGIVAYLMLTRHTPFEADSPHAIMYQHLDQKPPSPRTFVPDIAPEIEQVLLKALAKSRADRYPSVTAFAAEFQNAVEGNPLQYGPLDERIETKPSEVRGIAMPPPVYASYRQLPDTSQQLHRRGRGRWLWALFGTGVIFLVAVIMVGLFVLVGGLLSGPGPTPTPVTTPNLRPIDVPRVRIDSPANNTEVSVGEAVTVKITAFDSEGVTRIEARSLGEPFQEILSQVAGGESPFVAEFLYTPLSTGPHQLEIVAFRGDLAGESRFILLDVK